MSAIMRSTEEMGDGGSSSCGCQCGGIEYISDISRAILSHNSYSHFHFQSILTPTEMW